MNGTDPFYPSGGNSAGGLGCFMVVLAGMIALGLGRS